MCRKKKRVIHPRYHSPCQTPYTALRSLLSVALSSGMVKSNLIIPFISDKVNVQPFRRHCSVISDEGVQFKTARVFNSTAIFIAVFYIINFHFCNLLNFEFLCKVKIRRLRIFSYVWLPIKNPHSFPFPKPNEDKNKATWCN